MFQDFPNLKLIVGHGGGYVPYQVGRARAFRLNEMARDPDLETFDDSLRRLYFDTVLYNQESLELLFKVVRRRPLPLRQRQAGQRLRDRPGRPAAP